MVIEFSKDLLLKICLFGDRNVGKTSLTQAGIQKKEVKPPVCIDLAIKNLTIKSLIFPIYFQSNKKKKYLINILKKI